MLFRSEIKKQEEHAQTYIGNNRSTLKQEELRESTLKKKKKKRRTFISHRMRMPPVQYLHFWAD